MNELDLSLIPSKRFAVWSRLYERYRLEPFPAGGGTVVSKTIIPITDADALLKVPKLQRATKVITSAEVSVFTVPAGERWEIYTWDWIQTTGDRVLNRASLISPDGVNGVIFRDAGATSITERLPQPLPLDEGWQLVARTGGGTTDGDWDVTLLTTVEDAF